MENPMSRILIVDDDPTNQRILSYTLSKKGYETIIASNGEVALAILGHSDVDLAILDVAMPVMDGLTLLKNIRALEKFENLPIIILTGSGDDAERHRAERQGVQGFLTKPSSSKTIVDQVERLLIGHAES